MDSEKPRHRFRIKRPAGWHQLKPGVSTALFICAVLVLASLINSFIFQSYYVEGTSMQPTLYDDDRLLVGKAAVTLADWQDQRFVPERGDIVVLTSSYLPAIESLHGPERIVKRVIALPGEEVTIHNGSVTVYNSHHPEGFEVDNAIGLQSLDPTSNEDSVIITLGPDEIFVLGDNRSSGGSLDSRSFGAVKLNQIEGTLWMRVFPFGQMKVF